MRVFHRQIITLAVLATATAVFLNGTKLGLRGFGSGNGLLSDTNYQAYTNGEYNGLLFGTKKSWESMSMYLNLSSAYELEKNQGLVNAYGEAGYRARFSSLAEAALAGWQNHQVSAATKFFESEADDALGVQAIRRKKGAVMYAGLFVAAYAGRTLRYRVGDEFSIESRTKMADSSRFGSQYLGWKSNTLDASVGATYSAGSQASSVNLKKKISSDVSVTYEASDQQAVGVSFSKGF